LDILRKFRKYKIGKPFYDLQIPHKQLNHKAYLNFWELLTFLSSENFTDPKVLQNEFIFGNNMLGDGIEFAIYSE